MADPKAKAPTPQPKPEAKAEAKPEAKTETAAEAKAEEKGKSTAEGPARRAGNPLVLVGVVVGALALGGASGAILVGPRLIAARAAQPAAAPADSVAPSEPTAPAEAPAPEAASAAGQAARGRIKSIVYRLDNIIVNPAGSQGTRFLMASVAVELPTDAAEDQMREHEVQVRDAVIAALECQTLQMLTRPGARDSLKLRLAAAVGPLIGNPRPLRVYLPQFVIQ
jgi:flagellar FliL protein